MCLSAGSFIQHLSNSMIYTDDELNFTESLKEKVEWECIGLFEVLFFIVVSHTNAGQRVGPNVVQEGQQI